MHFNTICARHREQLINEPEWAIHCWQNAFDSGTSHLSKENLEKALPQLSFAFECAELLMTYKIVGVAVAEEIYFQSALSYARGLELVGLVTEALLLKELAQPISIRRRTNSTAQRTCKWIRVTNQHSSTETIH